MREILFRGKPKDKDYKLFNNWKEHSKDGFIYGSLLVAKGKYHICISTLHQCNSFINNGITTMLEVIPETIGQYTGLTDKNGNKIFEGDIVKMRSYGRGFHNTVVYFMNGKFAVDGSNYAFKDIHSKSVEVIGNIYDNM